MAAEKEEIKKKICEKLPKLLPGLIKTVAVHIVMMIYHISMPPWVVAMKAKKGLQSFQNAKQGDPENEWETEEEMGRRRMRRLERRDRRASRTHRR